MRRAGAISTLFRGMLEASDLGLIDGTGWIATKSHPPSPSLWRAGKKVGEEKQPEFTSVFGAFL
jgi:hypothetical protein